MGPFLKPIGCAIAVLLLTGDCVCPPVAIPLITSAALQTVATVGSAGASFAGAIAGANYASKHPPHKASQNVVPPAGVPQQEFDRCSNDLNAPGVVVTVHGPVNNNGVQMDGVPASCMNLATVIDGDAAGGPTPIPCGSACLLYDNLNQEDYGRMHDIFNSIKHA